MNLHNYNLSSCLLLAHCTSVLTVWQSTFYIALPLSKKLSIIFTCVIINWLAYREESSNWSVNLYLFIISACLFWWCDHILLYYLSFMFFYIDVNTVTTGNSIKILNLTPFYLYYYFINDQDVLQSLISVRSFISNFLFNKFTTLCQWQKKYS